MLEQPPKEKKHRITDFLAKAKEHYSHFAGQSYESIIEGEDPESKKALREKWRLPGDKVYGQFDNLKSAEAYVDAHFAPADLKEAKFYVRCQPKTAEAGLKFERKFNVSWDQARSFIVRLPGGADHYLIELRDNEPVDYSGIIIADGRGQVEMEMIKGDLRGIEKASSDGIYKAKYDNGRINWGENTPAEVRESGIKALQYFVNTLDREELEQLKIYAEFAHTAYGFRFYHVSDDDFWTNI